MSDAMPRLLIAAAFGFLYFLPGYVLCALLARPNGRSGFSAAAESYVVGLGCFGVLALCAHRLGVSLSVFLAGYCVLVLVGCIVWAAHFRVSAPAATAVPQRWNRGTAAAWALVATVAGTLLVAGGNNGLGFDEWSHLGSQDKLLTSDRLFTPNAFTPLVRPDGAIVVTYHDLHSAHLVAVGRLTGLRQPTVQFGSTFVFAALILMSAMTLAQTIAPGTWSPFVGGLLYLVLCGGSFVRASNTRAVASIALLFGIAQLLRWFQEGERRELWLAAVSVAVTVGIHNFYIAIWANVGLFLTFAACVIQGWRGTFRKALSFVAAVMVVSAPYALWKVPALAERLAYTVSAGQSDADGESPSAEPLADDVPESNATRVTDAAAAAPIAIPLPPLFVGFAALALIATLRSARRLITPVQAIVLLAGMVAPFALEAVPASAALFARIVRPERIARVWPDETLLPFLLIATTLAIVTWVRARRFAAVGIAALALAFISDGAIAVGRNNLGYPKRIAHHKVAAGRVIDDLGKLRAAMHPSAACVVAGPAREAFVLRLTFGVRTLYGSPRGPVGSIEGDYRIWDPPAFGRANEELLSRQTSVSDTVRLARDHNVCYIFTWNEVGGLQDKFVQNPAVFRPVATTPRFRLFELDLTAESLELSEE
jgi:hypothetical protein